MQVIQHDTANPDNCGCDKCLIKRYGDTLHARRRGGICTCGSCGFARMLQRQEDAEAIARERNKYSKEN